MIDKEKYVVLSLELHLFFARIMKEHSLFLKAGFTPTNKTFANKAEFYKNEFEKLLQHTITLSDGIIGRNIINSGEPATEFTSTAERQTQCFTGIRINQKITEAELKLRCGNSVCITSGMICQVGQLNRNALKLLDGLIKLKEDTLNVMLCCKMFTMNYPLLIEHIIREAKLYQSFICHMEQDDNFDVQSMKETEMFWNRIMMEHAMFIRGLLDPSEDELINTSDNFAKDYAALLAKAGDANNQTIHQESLKETMKLKEFKTAGVQGIENCKIKSVILPLLADHVLREANHYIRLLND